MKMRYFFFLIIFLIFHNYLYAYIDIDSFGFNIGLNQSKFLVKSPYFNTDDFDFNSHMNLGFFINFKLSKKLNVQLEPSYLGKGAKRLFYGNNIYYYLNYINLPLDIQYLFSKGKFQFYGLAGVQYSILVNSDKKTETYDLIWDGTIITHSTVDWTNKIDLDLIGGVGTRIILNKIITFFELKFTYGITDINSNSNEIYKNFGIIFDFGIGLYNGVVIY